MNKPINSAVLRLTAWYVGIIMLLSLGFSMMIYQLYRAEILNGLNRTYGYVSEILGPEQYLTFRSNELNAALGHIQVDLIVLNVFMLIIGAAVSYFLAKRNLEPVQDALEAQTRFTSDASHELRTPLAAMQTEIEVALRDDSLTKQKAVALLESNLEEVGKLKTLSQSLLRLAQIDSGKVPMVKVDAGLIVDEAVSRLNNLALSKSITIKHSITKPIYVTGDKDNLIELAVIILENAIKYSPSGSEIIISLSTQNNRALISFADRGKGISSADLPHIFERFYRADMSRSKDEAIGYGLGLSLAKNIIELHGGSIEVKSTVGHGSTFIVKLPLFRTPSYKA